MRLDVQRVRRAFSRAAPAYDAIATLQHQVEAELLDRLDLLKEARSGLSYPCPGRTSPRLP